MELINRKYCSFSIFFHFPKEKPGLSTRSLVACGFTSEYQYVEICKISEESLFVQIKDQSKKPRSAI